MSLKGEPLKRLDSYALITAQSIGDPEVMRSLRALEHIVDGYPLMLGRDYSQDYDTLKTFLTNTGLHKNLYKEQLNYLRDILRRSRENLVIPVES